MSPIDYSQYTEYVTEGPIVHPVALDHHDLSNPLTLAALAEGYAHVATLGRLPTLDSAALDALKATASDAYHADVVDNEIVSSDPAQVVERLLWVRDRPEWGAGIDAYLGMVVFWQGTLFRCVQAHRTQSDWTPDATPNLWTRYYEPSEIPVWVQPLGSFDAYPLGARVLHTGHTWRSLIADNVWEPGAAGSESLWACEDCPAEPATPEPWVQPLGAFDAYNTGDRVTFEGNIWESRIDANVWSPAAYPAGWQLIGPV